MCGGSARGLRAVGLLNIGGIEGVCLSCGMLLARFAGGICRILEIIPDRLLPRVTPKNHNPAWSVVLRVLERLTLSAERDRGPDGNPRPTTLPGLLR